MRDINVTVVGNVGADPVVRDTVNGRVANFNLGSTPRIFDRASEQWVDGGTTWFRVACWRELGANVAESLRKGERVVVVGRLKVGTWEDKEGGERTSVEIVADHVGHELTFGTTRFTRVIRGASLAAADEQPARAADEVAYDLSEAEVLDADEVAV